MMFSHHLRIALSPIGVYLSSVITGYQMVVTLLAPEGYIWPHYGPCFRKILEPPLGMVQPQVTALCCQLCVEVIVSLVGRITK